MKKHETPDFSSLRSNYIDALGDFTSFLGTVDEADKAAKQLIKETAAASPAKTEEAVPPRPEKSLEELLAELDGLVGLDEIKKNVKSLVNLVKVRKLREENGLKVPPISLHMVFMGNPGTGKTTVARLIAGLYHAIGVLSKGQLTEVDRSGLVAGYVGQTAIKTSEVIKKSLGGVLFIDEAYALTSGDGSNDFGHEAIETLLKAMEDNRDDLVVIVAGYDDEMEEFIASNPGLESRFNRYFLFPDYTAGELMAIFGSMLAQNEYRLDDSAREYAENHFARLYETRDDNFGNARDVRNFFENAVSVHADRVSALEAPTRDELMTMVREDMMRASEMGNGI